MCGTCLTTIPGNEANPSMIAAQEEALPHVQGDLPGIRHCPFLRCIAGPHRAEPGPCRQGHIRMGPSQSSLPEAEQLQLSQPVLTTEMLQLLHHLHSPPLDMLQELHSSNLPLSSWKMHVSPSSSVLKYAQTTKPSCDEKKKSGT